MSNVSEVTPYEENSANPSDQAGVPIGAAIGSLAVGCATVVRWLIQENDADRKALSNWKAQRTQAALDEWKNLAPQTLNAACLHFERPHTLVQTALGLGFRAETISLEAGGGSAVLLSGPQGQRLVISPNAKGRLTLLSGGEKSDLDALVRQHSLDRAMKHLRQQGMQVQTTRLQTGEVQILARESIPKSGGKAEITARIRNNGTAVVDVDRIRGRRCEEIVSGLANAMGAKVSQTQKKEAYFQLPGEPTKTQVRV